MDEYYLVLRPWFFQSMRSSTIVEIVKDLHAIVLQFDDTHDNENQVRMAKILLKEIWDFFLSDFEFDGTLAEALLILRNYI